MPPSTLSFRRAFPLVLAVLVVLALLPQRWSGYGPVLSGALTTLLSPVSGPLLSASSALRGRRAQPELELNVQRLTNQLWQKEQLILALQYRIAELQRENAALQDLRRRLSGQSYFFRRARITGEVIAHSADTSAHLLTLDLGARDGLTTGVAAVEGAHLVGRIIKVAPSTAILEPITAPGTLLNAVVTPPVLPRNGLTPQRAHIVQFQSVASDQLEAVAPHDFRVEIGDLARLRDPTWPESVQGMILGRVTAIEPLVDDPLRKRIVIQPMLSIAYLDAVTVIVPRRPTSSATRRTTFEGNSP